jgi:uncharacterized protein
MTHESITDTYREIFFNFLLPSDTDPNARYETLFIKAVEKKIFDLANILIDEKLIKNYNTKILNTTLLIEVCKIGNLELTTKLINNGALLDLTDDNNAPALNWAAYHNHIEIVKLLIDCGANINIANRNGCAALFFAAREGYMEIAKLLVNGGANIDVQNTNGNTALILAAFHKHTDIVKLLIDCGADTNIANT